jgi:REP element-mobilizing transposase RayT
MRHRLYVHIVWTTRHRRPSLDARAASFLASFLPAIARQERSRVLAMGLVSTHVHLLMQLHPQTNIPRLIQRLKGGSSVVANRDGHAVRMLRWSKGYNLESVSARSLGLARSYVLGQSRRHPSEAIPGWETGWAVSLPPLLDAGPAAASGAALGAPPGAALGAPSGAALAAGAEPRL